MGKISHASVGIELSDTEFQADTLHRDSQGNDFELSRSATLVLAASNASDKSKAGADIVCEGTAATGGDDVDYQSLVTALPAFGGGIQFTEGYYYFSTEPDTTKRIHLNGVGKYSTIIYAANSSNINLISSSGANDSLEISNLMLDGNKANNPTSGSGIVATNFTGGNLNNVILQNFREYGITHTGASTGWRLDSVVIAACEKDDFSWTGGGGVWLDKCYFLTSTLNACNIWSANDIWITNSCFDQSGYNQCAITSCGLVWITNDYFGAGTSASYNGLLVSAANNLTLRNNKAYQNTGNGFYISGAINDAIIDGNDAYDNGQWGFRFPGMTATNVKITNNTARLNGVGQWSTTELGTGAVYEGNAGLIAPGEVRTDSGALTGGAQNAILFAWHNPELQDILITKVVVNITTLDGDAANIDVGIADNATYTNGGTEFFNDLKGETAQVNDSWTTTEGQQSLWVLCQDSASATDGWIVGKILDDDGTSIVGSYYIEYVGK